MVLLLSFHSLELMDFEIGVHRSLAVFSFLLKVCLCFYYYYSLNYLLASLLFASWSVLLSTLLTLIIFLVCYFIYLFISHLFILIFFLSYKFYQFILFSLHLVTLTHYFPLFSNTHLEAINFSSTTALTISQWFYTCYFQYQSVLNIFSL